MYLYTMILVTGATGLVGSHLLLKLTEGKQAVRAIYRSKDRIKEVEKLFAYAKAQSRFSSIEWLQADITNIPQLTKAFQDIKLVYHCAAFISFDPYDFDSLIKVNVEGTANVVNLCLAYDIKKICHLSTIASLSKLPYTPVNEENHWDPNEENSVYAISKYGAETEVWRASQEGLDVLIFNPGVILGEGSINEGSGKLFKRILNGRSHYTMGGTAFIDVKDLVALMVKGMASTIKNERFIAIAHNTTFQNVLTLIAKSLSKKAPLKKITRNQLCFVSAIDKLGGLFSRKRKLPMTLVNTASYIQTFSNEKIKNTFSFTPTSLTTTLQRVATYHQRDLL